MIHKVNPVSDMHVVCDHDLSTSCFMTATVWEIWGILKAAGGGTWEDAHLWTVGWQTHQK